MFCRDYDDVVLEMARTHREALERIHAKITADQLGEAFIDRRADNSALRGGDRRCS